MPTINVTFRPSLEELAKKFGAVDVPGFMNKQLDRLAFAVERESKIESPHDTGRMRASIRVRPIGQMGREIAPHVNYAIFVHEGTRPHWIGSPVKIRKIGWRYIGMHPGYKGKPFMKIGAEKAAKNYDDRLAKDLEAEIQRKIK